MEVLKLVSKVWCMDSRNHLIGLLSVCVIMVLVFATAIYLTTSTINYECESGSADYALTEADIFFIDWSISHTHSYSVNDVKRASDITSDTRSLEVLRNLSVLLCTSDMTISDRPIEEMDGRLLIEGTTTGGEEATYFADMFSICLIEQNLCRENDELTRANIKRFVENTRS